MKLFAKTRYTVAMFDQEYLADIAQAKLIAAGIRAEIVAGGGGLWSIFSSAPELRFSVVVPTKHAKRARSILGKGVR
jgi:hypothetical protein